MKAHIVYRIDSTNHTELVWYGADYLPCWIKEVDITAFDLPWPIKIIDKDEFDRTVLACRTDTQPLMWLWHLVVHRLHKTLALTGQWLLMIGMVWGFAYAPPAEKLSIRHHLFRRKPKDT